ncbi:MerC domain-containing protein [Sphingomonas faeni]|uniref:MerC domain-containing protein n=1 Tax=Sphingomonas faeni TaxID=185950 RepID=UPI0020C74DF5|nr:MerC domain-containing protein [Sphingomonas faeni]
MTRDPHDLRDTGLRTAVAGGRSTGDMLDGLAVCASAACMIHCLALPLLFAALPALATWFDPGESFHRIILAFAIPTSAVALIGGWRTHRATPPLILGAVGLALMALGILFAGRTAIETTVSVTGSLFLAAAHLANWRNRFVRKTAAAA